jgi:hypothetical protein
MVLLAITPADGVELVIVFDVCGSADDIARHVRHCASRVRVDPLAEVSGRGDDQADLLQGLSNGRLLVCLVRRLRPSSWTPADLDRLAPQAIRDIGDKMAARHIAQRAGAPLIAGTPEPVKGADEVVVAFAQEHGLPVAIKATFGGPRAHGRAQARRDPALLESAIREAVAAFGRGECFVERYLDRPRRVEAQALADTGDRALRRYGGPGPRPGARARRPQR